MIKAWWKVSMMIVIWQNDHCNITKNKIRFNHWDKQVHTWGHTSILNVCLHPCTYTNCKNHGKLISFDSAALNICFFLFCSSHILRNTFLVFVLYLLLHFTSSHTVPGLSFNLFFIHKLFARFTITHCVVICATSLLAWWKKRCKIVIVFDFRSGILIEKELFQTLCQRLLTQIHPPSLPPSHSPSLFFGRAQQTPTPVVLQTLTCLWRRTLRLSGKKPIDKLSPP